MSNKGHATRRRRAIAQRLIGNRCFAGTIVVDYDDAHKNDQHRILELVDLEYGGFRPGWQGYWTDGSMVRGRLGASVVEIGSFCMDKPNWGIKDRARAWHLERCSGKSGDAELFAIAAALGMALDEVNSSRWMHTVRIYTDARSLLMAIKNSTGGVIGPVTDSADPLAIQLVYDRAEALYNSAVRVELHWVKGHLFSNMNERADRSARLAAECPPPTTGSQSEGDFEVWPEMPQSISAKGKDVVQEWRNLGNRVDGESDDEPMDESSD